MAGASLRVELFPTSLPTAIDFYTNVLSFKLLRHEPDGPTSGYAHMRRDNIQIGLSTKSIEEYPEGARDLEQRRRFRGWPTGIELVIEVDDLQIEWDRVIKQDWPLDSEITLQEWGLRDFRIRDLDSFFFRISERGGDDGRAVHTVT